MNIPEVVLSDSKAKSFFKDLTAPVKRGMSEWLMRQYFAEKNKSDIWFDKSVKAETVLEYISHPKNHFPLTPKEVVDFYKSMKSIQATLNVKKVSEEIDSLFQQELDSEVEEQEKSKHFVGEITLFDIGNELGGITRTMVNKIEKTALEKYGSLFGGKYPNELSEEEHEKIYEKIQNAQRVAADNYVALMKQCVAPTIGSRPKEFIELLLSGDHISSREVISPGEQEAILTLFTYVYSPEGEDLVKEMLICDNSEDNNVFKTFQYFVSYALYQRKKRGRPRKEESLDSSEDDED